MRFYAFRYTKYYHRMAGAELALELLNDPAVQEVVQVRASTVCARCTAPMRGTHVRTHVYLAHARTQARPRTQVMTSQGWSSLAGQRVVGVDVEVVPATLIRMDLFDKARGCMRACVGACVCRCVCACMSRVRVPALSSTQVWQGPRAGRPSVLRPWRARGRSQGRPQRHRQPPRVACVRGATRTGQPTPAAPLPCCPTPPPHRLTSNPPHHLPFPPPPLAPGAPPAAINQLQQYL